MDAIHLLLDRSGEEDAQRRAYEHLKDGIVSLRLRPGQKLPSQEVADEVGLSRTPVRDAMGRLAHEGLLEKAGGWGFSVRRITPRDVQDVFEVRLVLEPEVGRLALMRGSGEMTARLRELLNAAERTEGRDPAEKYLRRARLFHMALARITGNRLLVGMLEGINDRIQIIGSALVRRFPERLTEVARENRAVLEALAARDGAVLDAAIRRHIERPRELFAADHAWFEDLLMGAG